MALQSAPPSSDPDPIATLCFFRFSGLADRLWAFGQMGFARGPLRRLPACGFVKQMGAGTGEGFTPVPDPGAVAILTTWPDLATARAQTTEAAVFLRYRARAAEAFTLHLATISARGAWSGRMPFRPGAAPRPAASPLAVLTRGTVRPRALLGFWRRAPAISARIGDDRNVLFKAGIGEIPLLHQVTFSIWPDAAAMAEFARAEGPHAAAIRAVRAEGWFAEELYARFAVRAHEGSWGGVDPLAGRTTSALAAE